VGFDQEIFHLIILALFSVEYAMVVYGLYRIRLMIRIAEQHELMKVRAITVCTKVGIGRRAGHK
jgi:hypothetical protein